MPSLSLGDKKSSQSSSNTPWEKIALWRIGLVLKVCICSVKICKYSSMIWAAGVRLCFPCHFFVAAGAAVVLSLGRKRGFLPQIPQLQSVWWEEWQLFWWKRHEVGYKWELVTAEEGKVDWAKEITKAQPFLSRKAGSCRKTTGIWIAVHFWHSLAFSCLNTKSCFNVTFITHIYQWFEFKLAEEDCCFKIANHNKTVLQ